jgi:pimeloyl-ACP methyl ester carboxylesterase
VRGQALDHRRVEGDQGRRAARPAAASSSILVPIRHARALHADVPGSRHADLDSGHVVVRERPAELTALIKDFVLAG